MIENQQVTLARKIFLKFTAQCQLDAVEYKAPVYLMPLGGNKQELNDNTLFVVEQCIKKGFNYTDRTHIRAWNTKEGV